VTPRLTRRLWRHHLPLGLAVLASGWVLYATRPFSDVITRLSFASAWPALLLLAATLVIGPWRRLRDKAYTASQDLRRDIGIWAGITGLLHTGIGQCVHLRGRPWLYYIYEHWQVIPLRTDIFGLSNETGLIAALILLLLLATSSDAALRALGIARWKAWQRWNYACFALAALHSFGYLLGIEALKPEFATAAILCIFITLTLQTAAWRRTP
jgi:sulfoxide reductase heme-binding subunit YedZ